MIGEDVTFPRLAAERGFINLKETSLSISLDEVTNVSVDPSGRPIGAFLRRRNYRRGLDGLVQAKWTTRDGRRRCWLSAEQGERFAKAVHETIVDARARFDEGAPNGKPPIRGDEVGRVAEILERAAGMSPSRLTEDAAWFDRIYGRVPVLPPDQYRSLVIQMTRGCPYNRCAFCNFYRDQEYRVRDSGELADHVEAVGEFFGPALVLRRSVFLGDANAMLLDTPLLLEGMALVRRAFPELAEPGRTAASGIYTFADGLTGGAKSEDDLRRLAAAGMRRVYLGLESGHESLLALMAKPATAARTAEAARALKRAGIHVGVIVMVGLGGRPHADPHRRATLALLGALDLDADDIIYLSEFVEHEETPYGTIAMARGLEPLDAGELRAESAEFTRVLRATTRAKVSTYDIREFVY